jgi:hypothetical protein
MKNLSKIVILSFLMSFSVALNAQVLITLLLGDKLNSEKIEFGLIGGLNRSYINDISSSEGLNNFNLGFYFHFLVKNNSYLSTGVLVKSNVGASKMTTYPIGDPNFDTIYYDGDLTKKISYFYVPIMFHQRFNQRWYIEGGMQPGLRSKAKDIFTTTMQEGDLSYTKEVGDEYKRLDFGLIGGVGYKFKKEPKSMSVGINYYYGLVDVNNISDQTMRNSSIYFYMKIPIGVAPKPEKN